MYCIVCMCIVYSVHTVYKYMYNVHSIDHKGSICMYSVYMYIVPLYMGELDTRGKAYMYVQGTKAGSELPWMRLKPTATGFLVQCSTN